MSRPLQGKVAIVTGASRGCGKGIALQMAEAGCNLYITARPPTKSLSHELHFLPTLADTAEECRERGAEKVTEVYVDHSNMPEVEEFFERVSRETGGVIDILVNNAFSAVKNCGNSHKKFFEVDPEIWDEVNNVGLRNQYFCSVYGSRLMVQRGKGLIINISSVGGIIYLFNVAYGAGKIAIDRMSSDMAHELKDTGVTVLTLWPGAVRTELIINALSNDTGNWGPGANALFMKGESIEFAGRGVIHLALDPKVHSRSGCIYFTSDLCTIYGYKDVDGRIPSNVRGLSNMLSLTGHFDAAQWAPNWLRVPGWLLTLSQNRFVQ